MKFALVLACAFIWAFWLGGTILVFVLGWGFRGMLSEVTFHDAARAMFQIFSRYELVLAGLALLTAGLQLVTFPTKSAVLLVGCLVLAGGMVVTVSIGFMPRMEVLRNEGKTQMFVEGHPDQPSEYAKLHGKSMIAMSIQAGLLLLAGTVIMKLDRAKVKLAPIAFEHENGPEKHAGLSQRL